MKIDKNNQTLLELRSRSVNEQNKLQDTGEENDANEFDVKIATEKLLDDDETNLRGPRGPRVVTSFIGTFISHLQGREWDVGILSASFIEKHVTFTHPIIESANSIHSEKCEMCFDFVHFSNSRVLQE